MDDIFGAGSAQDISTARNGLLLDTKFEKASDKGFPTLVLDVLPNLILGKESCDVREMYHKNLDSGKPVTQRTTGS